METICHPLFLSRLTPSHNSSLAPPPSLDLITYLTQHTTGQTTRRLLIVGLIVFRWAWGSILYQTEVNGTDQINGSGLPTVVIPLSPSCNVSRTAVIDQDINAASPIGSRHNDMSLLASEVETITHPRQTSDCHQDAECTTS